MTLPIFVATIGYIVDSGTAYTPAIAQGEGFRNAEGLILDLKAGNYILKILDTN